MCLVQLSGCSAQYSGILPSVDWWDTDESSQQGNGAHSFFTCIPESCGFDPSGSDSRKLEDKLIAVPRTFILLIGNIRADMHLLFSFSIQKKKKRLKCRTDAKIKTESKSHCISTHLTVIQRGGFSPVEPQLSVMQADFLCLLQRLKLLEPNFLQDFKLHLIH